MRGKSNRLWSAVALVLVVSAIGAPAAFAAPVEDFLPDGGPAVEQGVGSYSSLNATSPPTSPPSTTVQASGTTSGDGFDWTDAGIGAASMLGLTAIAAGVVLLGYRFGGRHRVA
jgi:hypothetical protein